MFGRQKIAMMVAEFLGTFTLVSVVTAMAVRTEFPFFAASAAGLALAAMVLVIGPTSGAHINPAVTLGLWTLKKVETSMAVVYMAVQMLAGAVALRVNTELLDQNLPVLAKNHWDWRVFTAEAIGTLIFTFGIAAAIYNKYEGSKLATAIGASLFLGILVASAGATGALNPAVALGIRSWNAAYVLAPVLGSIVGMNLYSMLFVPATVAAKPRKK